jgi:hypothetical protein
MQTNDLTYKHTCHISDIISVSNQNKMRTLGQLINYHNNGIVSVFFLTKTVIVYIRGVAKPQIQLQDCPEFLRAYRSKYKL